MEPLEDDYFERIELIEEEQALFHKLKEIASVLSNFDDFSRNRDKHFELWKTGGTFCYELYKKLIGRGVQVKFNKYCLKNRTETIPEGPSCEEFHQHIDVILGMVSFIEFKNVHDDVKDVSLGIECAFQVYCKRRSEPGFIYRTPAFILRTPGGWWVRYFEINQETDKQCSALLRHIDSQAICLPKDIGGAFERLWNKAADGLGIGDFKYELKKLADWIEVTEKGRPDWF